MEEQHMRVLLVSHDPGVAQSINAMLVKTRVGVSLMHVTQLQEALHQLSSAEFMAVLLDLTLPDGRGLGALALISQVTQAVPLIVIGDEGNVPLAIEALRAGAQEYLIKGHLDDNHWLVHAILNAVERKRTHEMLRESEARYRMLAENIPDVVWTMNMDLRLTSITASVTRLLGLSADEAQACTLDQILPPEPLGRLKQVIEEEVALARSDGTDQNRPRTIDLEGVRKDGTVFSIQAQLSLLRDAASQPDGILCVARDISERKRVEWERVEVLAREQAAQRLRNIFAALSTAHTPFDVATILMQQATSLFGAEGGFVALVSDDGQSLEIVDCSGYPPGVREYLLFEQRSIPLAENVPLTEAVRSGESIFLPSEKAQMAQYPGTRALGYEAVAAIPLIVETRCLGVLGLSFETARDFGAWEKAAIIAMVQQCAQSLERAKLYADSLRREDELEARVAKRTEELQAAYQRVELELAERRRVQDALKAAEQYSRSIIDSSLDMIFTTDSELRIVELNRAAQQTLGYMPHELLGQRVGILYANPQEGDAAYQVVLQTGQAVRELTGRRKNGETFPVFLSASVLRSADDGILGVVGVSRDITEWKQLEEILRRLSMLDELTGLYNRRGFLTLAEHHYQVAARTAQRFSIISLDVEGLKKINDTFGHVEGDAALCRAANVLKQTFRGSDILARLAKDEFAVLAIDASAEGTDIALARLRDCLEAGNRNSAVPYTLSFSVGVATFDPGASEPGSLDDLIAQANRALLEHKRHRQGQPSPSAA
ncbi:MAG: PAS domain S-box protein [Chloroflexi bacterium]|nr:PAS domain S-box protein [Chloroflexota bacterium]